jgi:hypothetical protein
MSSTPSLSPKGSGNVQDPFDFPSVEVHREVPKRPKTGLTSGAIVCVKHLNKGSAKGGNREAMLRVTGSLGFVAAARAGYIIIRCHQDRRLFLPMKTNNGRDDMPGLAFTIESCFLLGDIVGKSRDVHRSGGTRNGFVGSSPVWCRRSSRQSH